MSDYQEVKAAKECDECGEIRTCVGMLSGDFAASTPFLCERCLREYIQLIKEFERR